MYYRYDNNRYTSNNNAIVIEEGTKRQAWRRKNEVYVNRTILMYFHYTRH